MKIAWGMLSYCHTNMINEIITPIQRKDKLSGQVGERIQELILSRKLKPGDRLPTERELGQYFQVSRTVIREAMRTLEARGLVESQTGSGTYVRAIHEQDVANSLGLYIFTQGKAFTLESLMEVRRVLEFQMVRLAAERATNDDLEKLSSVLEEMRKSTEDTDTFSKWDLEFHMAIARASGNPIFGIVIEPLTGALFELVWVGSGTPGAMQDACDFHSKILDCIKKKDPDLAERTMRAHLDQCQRVATERLLHKKED